MLTAGCNRSIGTFAGRTFSDFEPPSQFGRLVKLSLKDLSEFFEPLSCVLTAGCNRSIALCVGEGFSHFV